VCGFCTAAKLRYIVQAAVDKTLKERQSLFSCKFVALILIHGILSDNIACFRTQPTCWQHAASKILVTVSAAQLPVLVKCLGEKSWTRALLHEPCDVGRAHWRSQTSRSTEQCGLSRRKQAGSCIAQPSADHVGFDALHIEVPAA
jgi:hypothetical protein